MSPFTILVLCIQACLIQMAVGRCSNVNLAAAPAPVVMTAGYGSFGASGEGECSAVGGVSANGQTAVLGSVPCDGTATFSGPLTGAGSVAISGQCGCVV